MYIEIGYDSVRTNMKCEEIIHRIGRTKGEHKKMEQSTPTNWAFEQFLRILSFEYSEHTHTPRCLAHLLMDGNHLGDSAH